MSHLTNSLATSAQLYKSTADPLSHSLPPELQDSVRFYTARLTQAAGILLRLGQDITAQACVLLFRYWVVDDLMRFEFGELSAAIIYLTAKVSASPRSLRSITNVYAYLLSSGSSLNHPLEQADPDPESYYLSESQYISNRNKILHIEGQVLNALGFNTHVALPHPLAITYLQTLDAFSNPEKGKKVARRAVEYLNTALLSPQMLYLTHQPCALAVAACYLAAREEGVKMPEMEWWEVFDVEREELGFLAVGMRSLEGLVRREIGRWGSGKGMITRRDIRGGLQQQQQEEEEEEVQMARALDAKVGADS